MCYASRHTGSKPRGKWKETVVKGTKEDAVEISEQVSRNQSTHATT